MLARLLSLLLTLATIALADDEPFPEVYNSEPAKSGAPPSPAEAAAAFELPEGFEVSVFAAEPEVRNPIAMAWDQRGRMWVAENYTYAERGKRFDLALRDRVLVFEDKDGDGKADTRTVFSDDLQMLTSVEVGRGGVWAMCPPQLLFIPDRDGDDVPDGETEVVLDGFTVAKSNYHNFANGLRWGPDNWLYGRCGGSCPGKVGVPGTAEAERVPLEGGIWRYHPERKFFEVLTHGTTNPWGHDWDENGEGFFINTVNGHLWHLIPGAHLDRPFAPSPNKSVFEPIAMHADHWHFDTGGGWTKSRAGAANPFGGGHAHIGMCIYQGDHLPEAWRGKLLTWNQHGRRVNRERLERDGSGYVARHEPDVLLAGDAWFRGLDIRTGPDGALYALDWSDAGECHDHTGVHRESGRIYRFTHGEVAKPDLAKLSLAKALRHPNPWFERQARAQLEATPENLATAESVLDSKGPTHQRLRALWALNAMGVADKKLLLERLDDPDEHLRVWAIRLLTDAMPIDSVFGPLPHRIPTVNKERLQLFIDLAKKESSKLVRLALASILQRLPLAARPRLASEIASHANDAADHNLPKLVWFGIAPLLESDPAALASVAGATHWPDLLRWIARSASEDTKTQVALIDIAISDPSRAPHLLGGLADGFKGWRRAAKPTNWDKAAAALDDLTVVGELSALFGDGLAMDALKALVFDDKAELAARETALRTLIDSRPDDLRAICEKLLNTRQLNKTAVRGLAGFDDPAIGQRLAADYRKSFWPRERAPVIEVLVSRPAWAAALLDQIKAGSIPRDDLQPFHARQIVAFDDAPLTEKLRKIWGDVRQSDAAKSKRIAELSAKLTPAERAKADLAQGRVLFRSLCSSCHLLYGEGGKLGPDLTGSGRSDLGYLLSNIIDPSAVVSAEYRMSVLKLKDARVLSGVVAASTERTVTLRTLTDEITLERSEIAETTLLPNSIMPEGQLDALSPEQTRDLIAYLMHPRQVALPE